MLWFIFILLSVIVSIFGVLWGIKKIQIFLSDQRMGDTINKIKIADTQFIDPKTKIIALDYLGTRYIVLVGQAHCAVIDKISAPIDVKGEKKK